MARLNDLRRGAAIILRDPIEAADRVRNRFEARREREEQLDRYPTREELRQLSRSRYGYEPVDDWQRVLHDIVGHPWPCDEGPAFERVWDQLGESLSASGRDLGSGLDADAALASAMWCTVRHLRPTVTVETGVSRGIMTRVMLEALEANRDGRLWSIDLPPRAADWREHTRAAVPERLHSRWTFLRGSSRRRLPPLLRELGHIDLFIHDSQHTKRNMAFELASAWLALRPGGVLVADDIHENSAFADHTRALAIPTRLIVQEERKAGLFGIVAKPRT